MPTKPRIDISTHHPILHLKTSSVQGIALHPELYITAIQSSILKIFDNNKSRD